MFVPPKTTFEQRRETAAVGLERLFDEFKRNAAKSESPAERERARELVVSDLQSPKAVAFHKALEHLAQQATTQQQRERYAATKGAEAWHNDHVFLVRQVFWQEMRGLTGFELINEVWRRLSSSRYGRFQGAFCEESSAVVPRWMLEYSARQCSQDDKTAWKERLNTGSLSGVLVAPDLIPNRLAARLGLLEWKEGTSSLGAIEAKDTPAVIDGLKVVFESSVPLVGENTRIWRLLEPREETESRYPNAKFPESWRAGTFVYFRGADATQPRSVESAKAEFYFRRKIPSYFDSVYALYRATLHKSARYEQEVVALSSLAQSAEDLNLRLANDWRQGIPLELKTEMKRELEDVLARAAPVLTGMKHVSKREAGDILRAVQGALAEMPKSSDAVVKNMPAVLLRIVGIRNRLQERRADIPRKSRWNTEDQLHLEDYITKQEQVFKDIHQSLLRSGAILQRHQGFYDSSKPMSSTDVAAEAKTILQSLNLRRERLTPVTARPLITFAKAITVVIDELEDSVRERNRDGTETALVKLLVLTELEQANTSIERLKRFTTGTNVPFDFFERVSAGLLEVVGRRELFPGRTVPEYQCVHKSIQEAFTALVERFRKLKVSDLTDDERIVEYGEIRKVLDDPARDLEYVVAQLVGLEIGRRVVEDDADSEE
jgi:hypothetical protein